MSLKNWSTTASSNATVDSINFAEGQAPSSVNDSARALMADVKAALYNKGSDIASATTTDLAAASTEGLFHDITGTTTITGLGTVAAGTWKVIKFEGALTLTHNATSLILPGAANITTADGDIGIFVSEGSGNWRCVSYQPAGTAPALTGSFSTTWSFDGSGGTSGSVTLTYQKIGNWVTLHIPSFSATSGTGSTTATNNTALPAAIRAASYQQDFAMTNMTNNNTVSGASPGVVRINAGSGTINFFRDNTQATFTNSSTCGLRSSVTVSYFVG